MGYVCNQCDPHWELLLFPHNPRNLFFKFVRGYSVPTGHEIQNSALFIFAFLQACRRDTHAACNPSPSEEKGLLSQ